MMKAVIMTQYGDIDSSLQLTEVEVPPVDMDELLVKVKAASINPIDFKVLRGDLKAVKKLNLPTGIGRDVSGVVEAVGANVSAFKVGDEVFSRVGEEHVGTLAEYVTIDQHDAAIKPVNLTHVEAASIPLVGLTSLQALFDVAKLKAGEKVLIHAGSGGIGSLAIQLARQQGAYVATTTSTKNVELVKRLGADVVIDYRKQDYLSELAEYDVVYDALGGDYTKDAFKILRPGGRVVSIVGDLDSQTAREMGLNSILRGLLYLKAMAVIKAAKQKSAIYRFVLMKPNGQQLKQLAELLNSEAIRPLVDRTFNLDDTKAAFHYLATGRAKGKVVVTVEG